MVDIQAVFRQRKGARTVFQGRAIKSASSGIIIPCATGSGEDNTGRRTTMPTCRHRADGTR